MKIRGFHLPRIAEKFVGARQVYFVLLRSVQVSASFDQLLGTLSAIRDTRQRCYVAATRLRELDVGDAVSMIKSIREKALRGDDTSLDLHNGLLVSSVLSDVVGDERMSELVSAARDREEYDVVAMLMDVPLEREDEIPHQPFLDASLRDVPLGMRKALARKPDQYLMRRIAKDQDPRVIRHLLNNSRLTEKDVTQIACARPVSPKVLEEIYNHPKWIARYSVKKVIVLNPYTPVSMSLRLLTYIKAPDLEEILRSPHLDEILVDEARKALEKRRGSGSAVREWILHIEEHDEGS